MLVHHANYTSQSEARKIDWLRETSGRCYWERQLLSGSDAAPEH